MKCPVDNATLVMSDRQGIEIDYCPECRGVWLDRGELDKIVERSAGPQQATSSHRPVEHDNRYDDSRHRDDNYKQHHNKKREGFLGDLFDF